MAILGLATSAVEAWLWVLALDPPARGAVLGMLAMPYAILAAAGAGIQAVGWLTVKSGSDLEARRLTILFAGVVLTILGAVVVREARRLAAVNVESLPDARVGSLGVLLIASILTTALVVACVRMIRREPRSVH